MKKFITLIIVLPSLALLICCQNNKLKISIPSDEEVSAIKLTGDSLAKKLSITLKKELKAAIETGGFQNAITVCNKTAQRITDSIGSDTKYQVKRTSRKYRNPANAFDSIEGIALDYFELLISDKKEIPEYYVQKITENGQSYYRYYKPIKVEELCLGCHGKFENMDSATIGQLKALYPEDRASGYNAGDFRGLISVIIRE